MIVPTVIRSRQKQSNTADLRVTHQGIWIMRYRAWSRSGDTGARNDVKPQKWTCLNTELKCG